MIFVAVEWLRGWLLPYPFWIKDLGKRGEYLARRYWHRRGYFLVARNWRHGHGEVDAIMANYKQVVFLEVKTRSWRPEMRIGDQLSEAQRRRLFRLARFWLGQWSPQPSWRFVLTLVVFRGRGYEVRLADLV